MRSLRGHFLIASQALLDPNFRRSVILMVKHDDEGAMGLIVNAPLEVTVAEALGDSIIEAASVDLPLHRGGPCQGPMMVLHAQPPEAVTDEPSDDAADEVIPGVQITDSREDIQAIMTKPTKPARYIIGYAGWGTEQLESEIEEGSWLTVEATVQDIFTEPSEQWEKLTAKAGLTKFIPPDQIPEDPGLN